MRAIREWQNVNREVFENEIVPLGQPAVLKSLVSDWPAVQAGLNSAAAVSRYIQQFDLRQPASAIVGAPSINGRFFYNSDLSSFNFDRKRVQVGTVLDNLVELAQKKTPPAIAMQAVSVADYLPGFELENSLSLLRDPVAPRMWLGNRTRIAPHYDLYNNIACVVAGSRQFTVFPPEEIANLYIGPLLNTPGGSPISMVDVAQPDLVSFPRYAQALESSQQARVEPGDAVYLPILWWHSVQSLASVNVMVNYWSVDTPAEEVGPFNGMLHSMLAISKLPPAQRASWRQFFEHFVFQLDGDPAEHLPDQIDDITGTLSEASSKQLKAWLAQQLVKS